jgi:hypothetical protein
MQEPRATVSLWIEGEEKPTVIQIGAHPTDERDREKSYAKASSRDGVVLLPKTIEALATTKPNDLRDKNLVRVEQDIVDRINIEGAGKEKIVLARKGESWVRKSGGKDEAVNVTAARRVLEELRTQRVAAFVSDVATELARYGLDQPQTKLTLSSYASENTAETKAGEKAIATILFGKVEDGKVYARLEDEPFIVAVPELFLETLMTDPLQWQPLEVYNHKAENIATVEVTKTGQAAIVLERDKDKQWKLAKGDGVVNQINAQSLVNTLSSLRAVRWVGAAKAEHGLDKPGLTVAFKTADGGHGKLTVGAVTPDSAPVASVEGKGGVFELSGPDLSAFELPMLEKVSSQPAPALPGATPATPPPPAAPSPATEPAAPAPPPPQ